MLRTPLSLLVVLFVLSGALGACDSSSSDTADEPVATSTPAIEEAETNETSRDTAERSDREAEAPAPGGDNDGAAKRKDIRKLLEMTGSAKLGMQVVDQMISSFKMSAPNVPTAFWDEFRKDINENALIDLIVPIYDKHLTHEEIKALITFFESPAGKSYVEKLPVITQESQLAGQKWGREIAVEVQKRLQEKGYQ